MSYRDQVKGIIETVYKRLNYTLDAEVLEVLLDDSQHKIVKAPAGGTKTTLAQFLQTLYKLHFMVEGVKINNKADSPRDRVATTIPSDKILCLVFNRHNTSDIELVHARFYNVLAELKFISMSPAAKNFVVPGVYASTMHSYGEKIINDNLSLLKLREFKLATEENINAQFRAVVRSVMEKSSVEVTSQLIRDAKALYDLYVSLMLYKSDAPLTDSVQFELALSGVQVPSKYLNEIFSKFDTRKKLLRLHEYSDQLRLAEELLQVPQVSKKYEDHFYSIVMDEVQDFNPLMASILKKLVGKKTKTVVIGDGDQSIYSFLGAITNGVEGFAEIMGLDAKVFSLKINRRCKRDTLTFALNVINAIPERPQRDIVSNKLGGTLSREFYKDVGQQIELLYNTMQEKVTGNMGVLFRKKADSIIFSRFLYERQIAANYINAFNCMEHRLYTLFIDLLNETFIGKTHRGLSLLNRILPFSKDKIDLFLGFDEKKGTYSNCPNPITWHTLDFTPLYEKSKNFFSIHEQVEFAKTVARDSYFITGSDCMDQLLDMFYKNYFSYLTEAQEDPFVDLVLTWAKKDLSLGYSLANTVNALNTNTVKYMGHNAKLGKLNVSTIHGTKGLEFDHVIIANLEKDVAATSIVLSPKAAMFRDNEENRLFYVAGTRQKESLTVLCSSENRHRLSADEYFKPQGPVILESKFTGVKSSLLNDELLAKAKPGAKRKSLLLED